MLLLICAELPLLAGAALPLMKKGPCRLRVSWTMGFVCLTSLLALALAVLGDAEIFQAFSRDEALCFSLRLDQPGRLLLALIGVLCPPSVLFALEAMRDDPRRTAFFSLYLIAFGALILMALAGNLLTLFLGFTLLTGLGLPLTGHTRDRDGFLAQRRYGRCLGIGWILALTAAVGFGLRAWAPFSGAAKACRRPAYGKRRCACFRSWGSGRWRECCPCPAGWRK